MKKLKAFTLAEILITLTIIGVVAAVTVPTLTKKTGNQEYVSRLQKVYSVLSQATDEIILEKGNVKLWVTDADNIYKSYKNYLKNSKDCGGTSGCTQNTYKHLDGTEKNYNYDGNSGYKKLILADGTVLTFQLWSGVNCNGSFGGSGNVCAYIMTDINGKKGPNQFGRDYFWFAIKSDGLYPNGCDTDDITSVCSTSNVGGGCACRVINEGEMNY